MPTVFSYLRPAQPEDVDSGAVLLGSDAGGDHCGSRILRPVRPDDLETLFGFHRDAHKHHVELTWGAWDDAWQQDNFAQECAESTCEVLAEGDELIGYVQFVEEPSQVRLWNIVIRADRRGRRIGSQVVRDLQGRAATRNVALTLRVFPSNDGAHRLYSRLGFREVSRNEHAIELVWVPG